MQQSGYSVTPLAKKLGIKSGFKIRLINAPDYYMDLFTDLPDKLIFTGDQDFKKNCIHFFTESLDDLNLTLPQLKSEIESNGMIWVSWRKKQRKFIPTISENDIRNLALSIGLVDIKVCAVDEFWSGLKLVIPVKER